MRVVAAISTETVREGCRRHGLTGVEAVALARALTVGCLLVTLTKRDDERVRLSISSAGPIRQILVDARGDGSVRGMSMSRLSAPVQPAEDARVRLGGFIRGGAIQVTRDLGLEQPYQGVVALHTGEIDEDLERYLEDSEQLPSVLRCGVVLDGRGEPVAAGGILVQTLPGSDADRLAGLRERVAGGALDDVLRQPRTPAAIVGLALGGEPFDAMSETPLRFHCGCDRQRAIAVVSTLGAEDIDRLADEQERTEVRCEFCGDVQVLDRDDLRAVAHALRRTRS